MRKRHRRSPCDDSRFGFTLVVCLVLMVLISILVLGLAGLAAIELRRSTLGDQAAMARANARLALMEAIGQLQLRLGPDQRVSATAGILGGKPEQPHWTGVWRTTLEDGSSVFSRDDLDGGLRDARATLDATPAERVMEWLVSGSGDPMASLGDNAVVMARGTSSLVKVPKIGVVNKSGSVGGHCAWWTGDLGVRANVKTRDPRHSLAIDREGGSDEAWFRVMASQAADASAMAGGVGLEDDETRRLVSSGTVGLTSAGDAWARARAFDFTVDSMGVLADVARGGLKGDLTAFFAGESDVPSWKNLSGLSAGDSLIEDPDEVGASTSRHRVAGPRFGLLRDWARLALPFSGAGVAASSADVDEEAGKPSEGRALANESPVRLAGNQSVGLQPILVEASNFTQISTYMKEAEPRQIFQIRQLMYPRVVLWNPYNVELESDPAIIMIQGNGRQEMWTANENVNNLSSFRDTSQWLNFEGGRSDKFSSWWGIMNSEGYKDPYMGSYYFSIPATTFQPGDCLVFSPDKAAEYDGFSAYRPGPYDLNQNRLTCEKLPDPSRCYYVSASEIGGGINFLPKEFWYAPTPAWSAGGRNGVQNQSDDTRAILKNAAGVSTITFEDFDSLPQIAVLSASLQYGGGREPRVAWNSAERMPVELLDRLNPRPTVIPNVRTRESIRLRWFDEHSSNLLGSGPLVGNPHFEEALLANWNPRAAYALRSPWENIAGTLPVTGSGGGPWFFGAYTRDLYDQSVGWDDQTPVLRDGRCHGNPFGPPQEGAASYVLFDVPRSGTGVLSIGQFQHAKISELIWHPSYAIGNSLVDPRLGTGAYAGQDRSAARAADEESAELGGFHEKQLGWSSDSQRSARKDEWATNARAMMGDVPEEDNLVYDLSFEVNRNLWDRFFLSTGSSVEKSAFLDDPEKHPLPNARMRLAPGRRGAASAGSLRDFHLAASQLMVDGAFNVNSTRVEAWKALLASTRPSGYGDDGKVPFPRVLNPPGRAWTNGEPADSESVWNGYRALTSEEIDQLAVAIVNEVKLRGPFLSMADFVNRRLADGETGRMGALQAAIEKAGLNSTLTAEYPLDNQSSLPDYRHPDNIPDATLMEQTFKPASKAWGAPGWLTQADILQSLGPVLTARSDTFVIRAYGDAVDASGKVTARAWCEAVLQRTPDPLDPDESGLNPRLAGRTGDFGRRFIITSFRWLSPGEIS